MNIKKAKIENLKEIESLNKKHFHENRDFKEILENKDDYFFIAEDKDKIIGFSGMHFNDWNNTARIIDIFVIPEYRGKGCSDELIKKIKSEAKKLKVRTIIAEAPSLNNALATYLRNGFRVCGFNDRYYSNDAKEIAIFLSFDVKK
jgi:N-acetylglutamate synthase-like GNAT family acetyltransferase